MQNPMFRGLYNRATTVYIAVSSWESFDCILICVFKFILNGY